MTPTQLELPLPTPDDGWHLDDETRRVGRRGLAQARAALAASSRPTRRTGTTRRPVPGRRGERP